MSEYSAVPRVTMGQDGLIDPAADMNIQAALLDAVSEAISAAILVYDRNDQLLFVSRLAHAFIPISPAYLKPGLRLRDLLSALYDTGWRGVSAGQEDPTCHNKDEWLARQIAAHWKERLDIQIVDEKRRWTRYNKRRLPSGYGICVMSDITEQKKREEQWRADVERVQLTEEILDNLAHPVFVQDRDLAVVAVNKALCALLDVNAEASLGRGLAEFFDRQIADRLTTVARHVLENGQDAEVTIPVGSGPDDAIPMLVHIQRVGKPGRYFVVSSFVSTTALSGKRDQVVADALADQPFDDRQGLSPNARLAGRKALLVTADRAFETNALEVLEELGLDSCCVRNEAELEAVLNIAGSVGVNVDLAIVDVEMDVGCLGIIQSFEIDYMTLENYQVDTDLRFTVMDRLTALHTVAPVDDWEIDTGAEVATPTTGPIPLVLVAEDNPVNQIVFSQILEGLGFAYRIAASGTEVIRLAGELHPAVIMMDITLPDINGFEAARRIRDANRHTGYAVPIVGVLPQPLDRDRENCFAAGMADVILKPLSPDMLESVIRRVLPEVAAAFKH